MATQYGWIGLHRAARILGINDEELTDAVFESWAPPHQFTRDHMIQFRWTDVWLWKLTNGLQHRAYRRKLLYGH